MKITGVELQVKNKNRVNVSVDGAYRFSLDVFQLGDLGVRVGREYTEEELIALEREAQFGKLYGRALNYALRRPHSEQEIRDYLRRVSIPRRLRDGSLSTGIPADVGERVFDRLVNKGYVNDTNFVRYWVDNRKVTQGVSRRRLQAELRAKGVKSETIDEALSSTLRDDKSELRKVIEKKAKRYPDTQKLIAYLIRQGFSYDDIKAELENPELITVRAEERGTD